MSLRGATEEDRIQQEPKRFQPLKKVGLILCTAENSRFAIISGAEASKIQEDAVLENTKKATKSVVEITE